MKVMLDTNIIISAALFPDGRASKAFLKAMIPPYQPFICDYIIEELQRKFQEKFPERLDDLELFLQTALQHIQQINTPDSGGIDEVIIRDVKDQPILRAAVSGGMDLLLTGDKDFLSSSVKNPRIISVSDFLEL